ncbi:uncharacterized protein BDFB_000312 [Asbolus verrucosus]|uniref:Uncharacterized protein n=1 Tax=Asbolus verrucosus TaxID=1661398 RepID=A0A482VUY1_ASBVE|nr:uncharacterized protein BDFB_000312 [Asbolus verrucosus]
MDGSISASNWQNAASCRSSQNDLSVRIKAIGKGNTNRKIANGALAGNGQSSQAPTTRYSANNLSSPESAYSTGYSTDGTSPGAPPDYYINIRTEGERCGHEQHLRYIQQHRASNGGTDLPLRSKQQPPSTCAPTITAHQNSRRPPNMQTQEVDTRVLTAQSRPPPSAFQSSNGVTSSRLSEVVASPVLTSPRQRNRIRTNPWVPGSTLSPGQIRQETPKITTPIPVTDSPVSRRFLSPSTVRGPSMRNQSLSSSSCSSLSGTSIHWEPRKPCSGSEEDDCTLNEMMGKYDESYVYEKETDILSDSDPTDCDTDIDTGQDGGDEDDPLEGEFDFIDNGSYLELDPREDRNTGHCTYYNFEVQRKASRRRTARRSKQCSEKRRRSSSNKKRHKQMERPVNTQLNGSKSAGATPLSVRRTKHHPVSKLALDDCLKKRSNSISFCRDSLTTIDKRDKEADRKYKELIVEAEHILRSMKTNGLSPRRIPGPANKRVEILRSAECAKPELFMKNRLIDESGPQFTKIPSNNFSCPRYSPKRNHITNFMINNSPALMRREAELPTSPLVKKPESPKLNRNHNRNETNRRSPKYRKKSNKAKLQECPSSSSDSDTEGAGKVKDSSHATKTDSLSFGCPQSEPVRRKVYSGRGKTVAFNLNYENVCNNKYKNSSENLRQQVLLNTIANLKRSLEDQSASLKQVYRSSQNIHL